MSNPRASSHVRLVARAALGLVAIAAIATPMASAKPAPKVAFFGGGATVQFDPAVFTPLGVAATPGTGAVPTSSGIRFKITGGDGTTRYPLSGQIRSVKGMTLQQGDTRLTLNWFNASLGGSHALSEIVGSNADWGPRMTLFSLNITKPSLVVKAARFQLNNVPIVLTPVGAAVLNAQFGAGAAPFTAAQQVGTLQVRTSYYVK